MSAKTKTNIHDKLLRVQIEISGVKKTTDNKFFNSKYFDINNLLKIVRPVLSSYNLVVTQPFGTTKEVLKNVDRVYNDESDSIKVWTIISDGEDMIHSSLPLPSGLKPQNLGSAITYFRRYTLASLLALPSEDDDGNATQEEPEKVEKKSKSKISEITTFIKNNDFEGAQKYCQEVELLKKHQTMLNNHFKK
ncbi:MAG: putative essential recombination function protein [Prokaryotic dsDNA virus sp.]|nr:MAG: putative essential recombination function protein [Prokaryotic dsDNA virus sp.]|tara:strand:- start:10059 stop:10634 length:576 start_codon:yes stop_codon:yes gene_type:complete